MINNKKKNKNKNCNKINRKYIKIYFYIKSYFIKFYFSKIIKFIFLCFFLGIIVISIIIAKIYFTSKFFKNYRYNRLYRINNINLNYLVFKLKKPANSLKQRFYHFFDELLQYNHTHLYSNKIFWCWLQGKENAPKLSKVCLNSLIINCKKHEIIIITEKNMNQYIHFPPYILQMYKNKYIPKAQFSDLLRLELLVKYGGTWIDSSVLMTKYEKKFFKNDLFFFQIFNKKWIAGSNWFITSEKESPILKSTLDLLYEYWRKYKYLYNYFIFHIFFKMVCDKYQKDYEKIFPYSSDLVHKLQFELYRNFRRKIYKKIVLNIPIHKLTPKHKIKLKNGLTYYHILEEYKTK